MPDAVMIADETAEASGLIAALCAPAEDPIAMPAAMVVVAHPDDEVIGCGSRLPRLCDAAFVCVTDGAPRDGRDATANGLAGWREYALARRDELESALAVCGITPGQIRTLDCPDQQACLRMPDLARELADLIMRSGVASLLTHPYEGGHPDHDATAFAVHAAAALVRRRGGRSPEMVEMTSYHNGPAGICPCEFLPFGGSDATTVVLTPHERELKRRLFDCFRTQKGTIRYFPIEVERFRPAPAYDFTAPPHEGKLFYECFDWGMNGARFRELAAGAMEQLGLRGRL